VLGGALLTSGAITAPQLEEALDRQRETGSLLGETLLALEFITSGTLTRALAEQADVPFVAITQARPDRAVAALVPESFARKRLLAPLAMNGSVLQVVQANPFDVLALDDLRQFISRPVSPICAPPDEVRELLDRCYAAVGGGDSAGEASVALPPDTPKAVRSLSELGLTRRQFGVVSELLTRPRGLVLVSGPAGAGKTSTLYAMATHLANASKTIVMFEASRRLKPPLYEESIDHQLPGVRRMRIDASAGVPYAAAIRAVLRQYPDVVMIGDMQEPQAAEMAFHASQSGILVVGALTTGDSVSAVTRLVEMGLEPYLLASALTAILGQRPVRLICSICKEPATYAPDVLERVGLALSPDVRFYRGRGCAQCGGTGYRGRTGAFELLVPGGALQALICEQADVPTIAQAATRTRMNALFDDALAKAILQQTTLEEVVRLADGAIAGID
jgi:type II/IV secretion system protein/type II secretion system (T2SS) protein E